MDAIDRKILTVLQADSNISIAELADRVGLSQTPCWKRIQRLEQSGVIIKRVALVAPEKIGPARSGPPLPGVTFYKKLIETIPLKNVTSRFAMERIKATTAYKVPDLPKAP